MTIAQVYDNGAVFGSEILDIEEKTLLDGFLSGAKTIAAISLATGIPTLPSIMHSVVNSYKNLLAISIATDFEFEGSKKVSFGVDGSRFFRLWPPVTPLGLLQRPFLLSIFTLPSHTYPSPTGCNYTFLPLEIT
jgi:hypothetical protein